MHNSDLKGFCVCGVYARNWGFLKCWKLFYFATKNGIQISRKSQLPQWKVRGGSLSLASVTKELDPMWMSLLPPLKIWIFLCQIQAPCPAQHEQIWKRNRKIDFSEVTSLASGITRKSLLCTKGMQISLWLCWQNERGATAKSRSLFCLWL